MATPEKNTDAVYDASTLGTPKMLVLGLSKSEFLGVFGLEGFFMRWTSFGVSLLVMSSEYESMI